MRPIGGVFFGTIGDTYGRKVALSASIMCMALPTALIGILPTYDTIGITATILMILVRMLQGLSMGGALTSSISFLIEHTPHKRRGCMGSISMSSLCAGILLGSLASYIVQSSLTPEQFIDWGWRLPFLFGIFIMFAGIYIKKHMSETPMFERMRVANQLSQSPLKEVLKKYWFDIIISIFINATGSVIFYLVAIYLKNFLKLSRDFSANSVENLANVSYVIMTVVTVVAGFVSDRVGRKKFYTVNLLIIVSSIFFIMQIFDSQSMEYVIYAQIVLAILAAAYIGPEPALQAEFYPAHVRNTALSLSYNIAVSLFGGTTPFVLEYLVQKTGSIISCAYYVLACSIASMIALYFYKNRSSHDSANNT